MIVVVVVAIVWFVATVLPYAVLLIAVPHEPSLRFIWLVRRREPAEAVQIDNSAHHRSYNLHRQSLEMAAGILLSFTAPLRLWNRRFSRQSLHRIPEEILDLPREAPGAYLGFGERFGDNDRTGWPLPVFGFFLIVIPYLNLADGGWPPVRHRSRSRSRCSSFVSGCRSWSCRRASARPAMYASKSAFLSASRSFA